jgi:hypothetical protein
MPDVYELRTGMLIGYRYKATPTREIRMLKRVSITCFFGAFTKLQNAAIEFVMPVHLSAWTTNRPPNDGLS